MNGGTLTSLIQNMSNVGYDKYIACKGTIGEAFSEISKRNFAYKTASPLFYNGTVKINYQQYSIEQHAYEVAIFFLGEHVSASATRLFWLRFAQVKRNKKAILSSRCVSVWPKAHKSISFIFSAFIYWYTNNLQDIPPKLFMHLLGEERIEREARKNKKFEFVFPSPQTEKELVCQNLEKEIAELGGMEYYLAYELNFVHPKHSA